MWDVRVEVSDLRFSEAVWRVWMRDWRVWRVWCEVKTSASVVCLRVRRVVRRWWMSCGSSGGNSDVGEVDVDCGR